jgi:hypothetical protein
LGILTPRLVPEAYVRAVVASYPLVSKKAFEQGMTELVPSGDDEQTNETRLLWSDCEGKVAEHGWSLDRLIATRDFFWFRDWRSHSQATAPVPLHRYLRNLANIHLKREYGITEIRHRDDATAFEAITHYRWLTFALPDDLLLTATGVDPPPSRVDIEPPLVVRRLLDRGVAEIHQHAAAGMNFQFLWVSILAALADPALREDILDSPNLVFDDSETTVRWLHAAATVRALLVEFLLRQGPGSPRGFLDFVAGHVEDWPLSHRRTLYQALSALLTGQKAELATFQALRALYEEVHPNAGRLVSEPPGTVEAFWRRCDPIAVRLRLNRPNAGEQWLTLHALRWLEDRERAGEEDDAARLDESFERLFWQVVRLRCICYQTVVQRPMTPGLQWFVRFAGRLSKLRPALQHTRAEVSYQVAGGHEPIAAMELRTGTSDSPFDLADSLSLLLRSWRRVLRQTGRAARGVEPEFGVVLHFIKERDKESRWARGSPPAYGRGTHSEPEVRGIVQPGGRFALYFAEQSRIAQAIVDLMQEIPQILWLLRGIDVANDELSVPTWVLAPLYNYVETWSALAATTCSGPLAPPPLRVTAHVGEDFRHLMEGMRRVFETVRYLLERAGGRLGHATALGHDPRLWAESVGSVMMPAEERLWDLVFEWRLYSQYRIEPEFMASAPAGRTQAVANQIGEISNRIYGHPIRPNDLAEVHHVLHRMFAPPVSYLDEESGLGSDVFARSLRELDPERIRNYRVVLHLLKHYREDEAVFVRGQELVDIPLDESEVAALQAVQEAMRRSVGARGIVVEVNPSSNLLIGHLLDLRSHPMLRLSPPELEPGAPPPVHIAVGSDDPITFSTYLLREYSLLYQTALSAGYSEKVVQEWLAAIRQTSMDSRFTLSWKPTAMKISGMLLRELDGYLQHPHRCRALRRRVSLRLGPANIGAST